MRATHGEAEYLVPLTPIHYQLLLALAEGPSHGYGLQDRMSLDSEGILKLGTSTIYLALKSLVHMGFVAAAGTERSAGSPHPRVMYELTTTGRAVTTQETERLAGAVALARRRLADAA